MTVRLILMRLISLVALAVSAALLASYLAPEAAFCAFDSGCDEVKHSRLGEALGITLPILSVVGFGTLLATSLFPGQRSERLLWLLAMGGGLVGLVLLLMQLVVIRHTCPYCVIVDGSAMALTVVAALGGRAPALPASGVRTQVCWGVGGALALLAGAAWVLTEDDPAKQPPPQEVIDCWVPGKVNVVEVANFGCPRCRDMDDRLARILAEEGKDIHFVRFMVALPEAGGARTAGEAYLCAEKQGKGKEMARELFNTTDLSPDSCARMAASLGLKMSAFKTCLADPATGKQLDATMEWSRKASPKGLPIIWIQGRMLAGVQSGDTLRTAIEEARQQVQAESHRAAGPKTHAAE